MSRYGLFGDENESEEGMGIPGTDNLFGDETEEETEELDFSHDDDNL